MEVIKLIGVLIVIVGFILKLDTLAVVVVAGLGTVPPLFSFSHCRSSESVNGTV